MLGNLPSISVIDTQAELLHTREAAQHRFPVLDAMPITSDIAIRDITAQLIDIIEQRHSTGFAYLLTELDEPRHGDFLGFIYNDVIDGISELDQLVGLLWDE